jgi:prophage regulatory protein
MKTSPSTLEADTPAAITFPGNFIRLPEVKRMTGLSRASIYKRKKSGDFPAAVNLGCRLTVWVDTDIHAWMKAQIERNRS